MKYLHIVSIKIKVGHRLHEEHKLHENTIPYLVGMVFRACIETKNAHGNHIQLSVFMVLSDCLKPNTFVLFMYDVPVHFTYMGARLQRL